MEDNTGEIETLQPDDKKGPGEARRWLMEIDRAKKEFSEYEKKCNRIITRYRDEKSSGVIEEETGLASSKFNVLWSNIETLKPALYSRTPVPQVSRRFKDGDPTGRAAAEMLERSLEYSLESYDFDQTMKAVVRDFLLCARGQAWVRYVPYYDEMGQVVKEETACDYIHWSDFLHNPSRQWSEVRWVAKRVYMTRDDLVRRFAEKGKDVQMTHLPKDLKSREHKLEPEEEIFKKAVVWEVWDKTTRRVIWVSEGYKRGVLDKKEDFLQLEGFFPCPKPLYGTTTNNSLVPIPDYCQYEGQAAQLDEITARIENIITMIKIAGIYDESATEIMDLFEQGRENSLIPSKNWTQFAQTNGIQGAVDLLPIETYSQVLTQLFQSREAIKHDLYEITGMSDIIRGNSDPRETATAQQMKGRYATLRLSEKQSEVQRFARDIIAIKGEIIAEHFAPEALRLMSGTDLLKDSDPGIEINFDAAVQLLRSDLMRGYRVSIETDSTISVDAEIEKQSRLEFLEAAGTFLSRGFQAIEGKPQLSPLIAELLKYSMRTYKAGRSLETVLEKVIADFMQSQQTGQPDPKAIEAQMKSQLEAEKIKLEYNKVHNESQKLQAGIIKDREQVQMDIFKIQEEGRKSQAELASKLLIEQEKMRNELNIAVEKIKADFIMKNMEIQGHENLETRKAILDGKMPEPKPLKGFRFYFDESGNRVGEPIDGEGTKYMFSTAEDGSRIAIPVLGNEQII